MILVLPAGKNGVIVVADSGETPIFESFDEALRVGREVGFASFTPVKPPEGAPLVSPVPYHPGLTFDSARKESRQLLTASGRKRYAELRGI